MLLDGKRGQKKSKSKSDVTQQRFWHICEALRIGVCYHDTHGMVLFFCELIAFEPRENALYQYVRRVEVCLNL
jgi:hypothetical protein